MEGRGREGYDGCGTYEDDGTQCGVVGVWEAVDNGVEGVATLGVVVEACVRGTSRALVWLMKSYPRV